VVIAIPVMHGQQIEAGGIELAAAFGTNGTIDTKRLGTIILIAVNLTAHLFDKCRRLSGTRENDGSGTIGFHR
jgi:hypothetical protein